MTWRTAAILPGIALVAFVLFDALETILLPRTVTHGFRLTRLFYLINWAPWATVSRRLGAGAPREHFLSFFGPLSILLLIVFWASGLVAGFGLIYWAVMPRVSFWDDLGTALYLSGTTFFTLGLGDVKPTTWSCRLAVVAQAGLGFGFLASIIGYLPVIYAAFARREVMILRVDVRAGSPTSAGALLRRHGSRVDPRELDELLRDCEAWAAELLEGHLSYPILCFYRSQHRDQSWLATLTTILDVCALLIVGIDGAESRQAPITFAMARRAMLDFAHLFRQGRSGFDQLDSPDRLPAPEWLRLLHALESETRHPTGADAEQKLRRLRKTYEPSAHALSTFLFMPLPPWMPPSLDGDQPASAAEKLFEEQGATDVSVV